jgi:hypothetical protein
MTDNIELPPLEQPLSLIHPTALQRLIQEYARAAILADRRARQAPGPVEVSRWRSVAVDGLPPCDGQTVYLGENTNGYLCTFNWVNPDGCCLQGLGDALTAQFSGLEWWTEAPTRSTSPASTPVGEVPAGWKLVPVEPTEAMGDAGERAWLVDEVPAAKTWADVVCNVYRAMLAASPAPAASKGAEADAILTNVGTDKPRDTSSTHTSPQIMRDALAAAPSEPEAQKAVAPTGWKFVTGTAYGQRYVSVVEDNPAGKILINAYEQGFPLMFEFLSALASPSPAASMEVQGLTREELEPLWRRYCHAIGPIAVQDYNFAQAVIRALAAKNGWRLGEGQ